MQEEQEEMIKTGKPEKRRPSGFKNGVIIGLVLGLLITGIGAGVGIRAYANLTNNYVIFGPQGVKQTAKDNVLDQAAIKKVDELLLLVPRNIVGSDGFQWVLQIMQQPSNTYNFLSTFCSSSNNALLLGYVALNSSTSSLAVAFPFHLINCNKSLHTFLYNLLSVACAHCSLM